MSNIKYQLMAVLQQMKDLLAVLYRKTIHQEALRYIGVDASPGDLADDVLGCAESVTNILNNVMGFPIILGTWTLYEKLYRDDRFKETFIPMPGDIIISPTESTKRRGHVGIVGHNGVVLSNDSATGKFMANYTVDTWLHNYRNVKRLRVAFFTRVK